MNLKHPNVLIIGYGNPGRLDDGLGPAFARVIEDWHVPAITVITAYQLSVEDSHEVACHDFVIFADAAVSETDEFYFRKLNPSDETSHTTHHLTPDAVLGLAHDLFDTTCAGFELGIRGYAFDGFGELLSEGALHNLWAALDFTRQLLHEAFGIVLPTTEFEKLDLK